MAGQGLMSDDDDDESSDEEQQPTQEEVTQEFHDEDDGNATPPYGAGSDGGGETEPDDDDEATEAEDDEAAPSVNTAEERDELLMFVLNHLGDKFDETMKTWLPETWLTDDVNDVYELRSRLRSAGDNGPLPAATQAVLKELQPDDFVVASTREDGFISKYLQTDLYNGTVLLAVMCGLDLDYSSTIGSDEVPCPPLLRRWVRAADNFKQKGKGGNGTEAKKRGRPPATPRSSQGGSSSAVDAARPSSATRQAQRQRTTGLGPSRSASSRPAAKHAAGGTRRGAAPRAAAAAAAAADEEEEDEGTEAEEEDEEEEEVVVKEQPDDDESCSDSDIEAID